MQMARGKQSAYRAGARAMFLTEYDKEREPDLLRREERRDIVCNNVIIRRFPVF